MKRAGEDYACGRRDMVREARQTGGTKLEGERERRGQSAVVHTCADEARRCSSVRVLIERVDGEGGVPHKG